MSEVFTNHPGTTLSAAISSTTRPVTFSVASAVGLPATGNFRVLIDGEILLITSISGTSLMGSNVESTAAATHALNAPVQHILTAGGLVQGYADASDAALGGGLAGALSVLPPDPDTFTLSGTNPASTSTLYMPGQFFSLVLPAGVATSAKYYKPLPGATPWSIYTAVSLGGDSTTGNNLSIILYDASQNIVRAQRMTMVSGSWRWGWSSSGGDLSTRSGIFTWTVPAPVYMRILNDGTNVKVYWSMDGGRSWFQQTTEASSVLSTAVSYGFQVSNSSTTQTMGATLWSLYTA